MKSKLTLLLPEEVIWAAKRKARQRSTSVSALFAACITRLSEDEGREARLLSAHPKLRDITGAMEGVEAFDDRSASILAKHG